MKKLIGCGAAPGCVRGTAVCLRMDELTVERISTEAVEPELQKLQQARSEYSASLQKLIGCEGQPEDAAAILESYLDILDDDAFFTAVQEHVASKHVNVDFAIREEESAILVQFSALDDPYLRERATDISNVCSELIRRIQGRTQSFSLNELPEGRKAVLFAEDLTPDQTLRLSPEKIGGFVTEKGGLTSHTVILAKTLGVPAVIGLAGAVREVNGGEDVVLYGSGEVIVSPDRQETERFEQALKKQQSMSDAYNAVLGKSARTLDGRDVRVCTNIGNWKDSSELDVLDTCDGVGLYRTEFIYMESDGYPTEEQQFEYYRTVVQRAHGNEVIIRTLDIGGDKKASYMDLPQESNPFLGYRAIRLCLGHLDIFQVQLRAILRASAYGKAAIMFPMIASVEELRSAKKVLLQAKDQLRAENIPFDDQIAVGIMVETPAAVQLSDLLAKESDFFSIGTNDLIQYTTATDRMNENVQYLYDTCSMAVLRSVNMVCQNAAKYGVPVNMCGEAASDATVIPLWVAMGLAELSVVPGQVARTKYIVDHLDQGKLRQRLPELLSLATVEEVRAAMKAIGREYHILPDEG